MMVANGGHFGRLQKNAAALFVFTLLPLCAADQVLTSATANLTIVSGADQGFEARITLLVQRGPNTLARADDVDVKIAANSQHSVVLKLAADNLQHSELQQGQVTLQISGAMTHELKVGCRLDLGFSSEPSVKADDPKHPSHTESKTVAWAETAIKAAEKTATFRGGWDLPKPTK